MYLNPPNSVPETEIDFLSLVKIIWAGRRNVGLFLLTGFLAGCLVYMLSPSEYTASTQLPLLSSTQKGIAEANLGYTINYGVSANPIADMDLSRETYTNLLNSVPFQSDLLKVSIDFGQPQKQGNLAEYYSKIYRENPLLKYTIGLTNLFSGTIQREKSSFTSKEIEAQKWIQKQIRIELNKRESSLELVCTLPEATAAVQLTKIAAELLQIKLEEIEQSNQDYSLQQVKLAKANYEHLRHRLDSLSNMNLGNATFASKESEKEVRDQCAIAQIVYFELSKKRQLSAIQLSADRIVPQRIQTQIISVKKSSEGLFLTVLICTSLGLISGSAFVLGRKSFDSLKKKWDRV